MNSSMDASSLVQQSSLYGAYKSVQAKPDSMWSGVLSKGNFD